MSWYGSGESPGAGDAGQSPASSGSTAGQEGSRPGRAELRKRREAIGQSQVEPSPAQADYAAASRSELRQTHERQMRAARRDRALWKAWWLYPLLAVIAVCVYLGLRSASTPVPDGPQWVVTSGSPAPASGQQSP